MADRVTHLVPGFHSDVVWLEDQRDYAVSLMGDMGQNLAICRADPAYGVFLHELTYMKPYLDIHPEERADVRRWITEGRIGTGGSHSQPAEVLISAEGILRNILYGRLYHESALGDRPRIYMPWDVFGHCAQLAQILAKCRFAGCIWSKDIRGAHAAFLHVALDGTRLLFKRMGYGFPAWNEEDFLSAVTAHYPEIASLGFSADCRLDATDFKPPSSWFAGRCAELAAREPHAVVVSGKGHEKWLDRALSELDSGAAHVPVVARDYEWHHQGTAVSRVEFKIANRLAENALISAEKLATFAWLLGADYPDRALDKAWRQLLFNQHHDGITGPCCDRSYLDLMLGYREALDLAHEVRTSAGAALSSAVDTSGGRGGSRPVVVLNTLNWSRTEPARVRVEFARPVTGVEVLGPEGAAPVQVLSSERAGRKMKSAELLFLPSAVPGIGYSAYEVRSSSRPTEAEEAVAGTAIENEYFRLTADPVHGGLVSVYDKVAGREVLDTANGPANELWALAEKPDRGEPGWECYTTGPKWRSSDYNARVTAHVGPVRHRLVVRGEMKDCAREQIVTLYEGVPRIDFETRLIGYKGEHDLLVATFPVAVRGAEPVFEERFGATTKRKSRGKLDFRFHQWRNYSDCGARRCYQWIDLSGCAWIRFGDGRRLTIGMTHIVTSHAPEAVLAAEDLQDALVGKGIPVSPVFDDCDMARRDGLPSEDSILPRPDTFDEDLPHGMSFRIAISLAGDNTYARERLAQLPRADRLRLEKEAARSGWAAALLDDDGMPSDWPPLPVLVLLARDAEALRAAAATLSRDLADAVIDLPTDACLTGRDLVADDYGIALLNLGNVLCSVERDDTLVLFLMHTAAWGGAPWGKDRLDWFLVPEHKTHVFHYSLVPHGGDWRQAEVMRLGYEYNNPLLAVATKASAGPLPPAGHLLEVGGGVIATAVKPRGNPTAEASSRTLSPDGGITVRVYEPTGRRTVAALRALLPVAKATGANLLEEPSRGALKLEHDYHRMPVAGYGIEAAHLTTETAPWSPCARMELGPARETAPVLHFRHWDHNLGAEPLGYSPVAISLRGTIREGIHIRQGGVTVNTIEVVLANNLVDAPIHGEAEVVAPDGWHAVPQRIPYGIGPLEHKVVPVLVCFDSGRRDREGRRGLVKARVEHDGTVYQDVIEVGGQQDIEWAIRRHHTGFAVDLRNPGPDPIEGQVFVATPLEVFGECAAPYALGRLGPRERYFALGGGESASLEFEGSEWEQGLFRRGWAVVKVAYNGRVFYRPV